MKRITALLMALMMLCFAVSCAASAEKKKVMVSFYPIYILAMNVFSGIDSVELDMMTAPETGCLHDYQLMAGDMMKLADADALIVCGAGMEPYLQDVMAQFPELEIIDCSAGIDLIYDVHPDEDAPEPNAHTWLDAMNALQIVRTIADAAISLFPAEKEQIQAKAAAYSDRLLSLDEELRASLASVQGKQIVTFHEAFPYFAKAYGLEIAAVINEEHEDTLSPAQLYQVIEAVKKAGNPPLFTEPQYSDAAAYAVAAETGAKIYALDPIASGVVAPEAYEAGMRSNAEAILKAFE